MAQEDLINVFKYIVKKCDMLINNRNYEADAYTQNIVEDIAELCNHILDGDYGKLVEVNEVKEESVSEDLGKYINELSKQFPEVSFAKLSRIAVRVAKWHKEQMTKNTLEPDDPATEEEIKAMLEKRRYNMLKKVQHECHRQLQEQYDNGYDDGYKEAERVTCQKYEDADKAAMEYVKTNHSPSEVSDFQAAMNIAVAKAYNAGMKDTKEQMMKDAIEREVQIDAGGYPYIDCHVELYDYDKDVPLAKKGDKVKVIVLNNEL